MKNKDKDINLVGGFVPNTRANQNMSGDTKYDGDYELLDGQLVIPNNTGTNWLYESGGLVPEGQYIYYASDGKPVTTNNGQYVITGIDGSNETTTTPPPSNKTYDNNNPLPDTTKSQKKNIIPTPKGTIPAPTPSTDSDNDVALQDEINALKSQIQALQTQQSTNSTNVGTNKTNISANTSSIAKNTSDINTLQQDINTITANDKTIISDYNKVSQTNEQDTDTITTLRNQIASNQTQVSNAQISLTQSEVQTAEAEGAEQYTQKQVIALQKQVQQLQNQNQALTKNAINVNGTVQTAPTILTVPTFQHFTTNYYLAGNSQNQYYTATLVKRLPSIISNVEVNLNAMLNGRLYERYTPGAVVFKGWGSLTPQVEEQTLYQCLTECVEYRLITQQYVNLTNSYSGMVNGQNNYQTQNNNVIGLRQDIQAKLSLLGLYANVLLGKKVPKSTEYQKEDDGFNTINFGNLQQWYGLIQNTAWNFTKPISFQGGMSFQGQVTFNNDVTLSDSITVPTINSTSGVFSNSLSASTFTGNNLMLEVINTKTPYVSMTSTANGHPCVSFMVGGQSNASVNNLGNTFNTFSPTTPHSSFPPKTVPSNSTITHTGKVTTPSTPSWTPKVHETNLEVTETTISPPSGASPLQEFSVYASTLNLWGSQINTTGNWTFTGNTTLKNATIEGDFNLNSSNTPTFSNGLTVSGGMTLNGGLTMSGTIDQTNADSGIQEAVNTLGYTNIFNLTSPVGTINNLNTGMFWWNWPANNTLTTSTFNISEYLGQESDNNYTNSYVEGTSFSTLSDQVGSINARIINSYGGTNFLVEQVVYDIYDLSQASSIPGYMHPLGDGDAYVNLQTLFLHTFGNGDLTNGYSYQFNVDWNKDLGLTTPLTNISRNVEVDSTRFTVYITGNDLGLTPITYMNVRLENASYTCNPFPSGVIARMVRQQQQVNNTLFRFNISVPVAVDNRQPDDSMFLHGAIDISAGVETPRYLMCAFTIRYWMRLLGSIPTTTTSSNNSNQVEGTAFTPTPLLALPMELNGTTADEPYRYLVHICNEIKNNSLKPTPQQITLLNDMIGQVNGWITNDPSQAGNKWTALNMRLHMWLNRVVDGLN